MAESYREFEAEAQYDGEWFRFGPSSITRINVTLPSEDRYIRADEWIGIRDFVVGKRRPPLARTLLADAEALAATGHGRSALTQAVTALEVSLNEFARSPAAEVALGPAFGSRLGTASLRQQVEHLGLSGSVNYLLPLLFSEPDLPQRVVEGCRSALAQRNNVVHNGQRDVQEKVLRESLSAIRRLCELLEQKTAKESENQDGDSAG